MDIEEDRMSENQNMTEDEEQRRKRRAERIARMREEKERQERINRIAKAVFRYGGCALGAILVIVAGVFLLRGNKGGTPPENQTVRAAERSEETSDSGDRTAPKNVPETESSVDAGSNADAESPTETGSSEDIGNLTETGSNEDIGNPTETGNNEDIEDPTGTESGAESERTAQTAHPDKITRVLQSAGGSVAAVPVAVNGRIQVGDVEFQEGFYAEETPSTAAVGEPLIGSEYAVLINESTNEIVAEKGAQTIINPASMTKVLTVLVAAEHVTNLDDTVTITIEMTDFSYQNDCSAVGFSVGEVVTVRDLFYGTVLPSGGDAAIALATYVAGSHEAFVEMMNEKLEELGLSDTAHFTNCVGLYDENHYCSAYDMAMILKAAVENDWCREVLSRHTYTTSSTPEHPDGITISNWFLRRIEDKDTGGEVLCGKTGFVNQSRNCAASYFISDDGVPYICVTVGAQSAWKCIYDHVALYSQYG